LLRRSITYRSNVSRRVASSWRLDGDQFEDESRRHVAGDQFRTHAEGVDRASFASNSAIANSSKSPVTVIFTFVAPR